jgi:hypothetical protein
LLIVDVETTLLQQFLNIAQRKRIAKIPPDGTKDDAGFGLPPFEDRRSGYYFAIVSRNQLATPKVATRPFCDPRIALPVFLLVGLTAQALARFRLLRLRPPKLSLLRSPIRSDGWGIASVSQQMAARFKISQET